MLKVESHHLKQEGVYAEVERGEICLEICMENEGTYLANGGGCAGVFIADETQNSGECISGYTLTQRLYRAGCWVRVLSV